MATERYLPFDYTEDDPREYDSALWAFMQHAGFFDGIIPTIGDELEVIEQDPNVMEVQVQNGRAFIQGRFYSLEDGPKVIELDEADENDDRIDRIVLRLDLNRDPDDSPPKPHIVADVKTGTPAESPEPPELERDIGGSDIYELSLSQVFVGADVTSVGDTDITDERHNPDLCGWCVSTGSIASHQMIRIFVQDDEPDEDAVQDGDLWIETDSEVS